MRTPDFNDGPSLGWIAPPSPVVKRLLIVNGLVFLTELLAQLTQNWWFFQHYVALSARGIESFMVWQLATYMFLHDPQSIGHILFNLLGLWFFGRDVEMEIGPYRFLKLYLFGGFVGSLFWLAFNLDGKMYLLGASGAVLAVCIAFAVMAPDRPLALLIPTVTIKAKYLAWLMVAFAVCGLLMRSRGQVAELAHLGGIMVGYLYIKWLGYGDTPGWMAAIQRLAPSSMRARRRDYDEFHSARPGVAYNHPYRTFEEEEEARKTATKKKGMFGKVLPSRSEPNEPEEVDKDEFIQKEIDPILDKIAKQGMGSLTRHERKILESAKDKIDKRK